MTNGATHSSRRDSRSATTAGTGSATIDNSTVNLDGVIFNNGSTRGRIGADVRIGRGVGANGAADDAERRGHQHQQHDRRTPTSSWAAPASLPGGTGTLNMSGGSPDQLHRAGGERIAAGRRHQRHRLHDDGRQQHRQRRCRPALPTSGANAGTQRHPDGRRGLVDHRPTSSASAATATPRPAAAAAPSSPAPAARSTPAVARRLLSGRPRRHRLARSDRTRAAINAIDRQTSVGPQAAFGTLTVDNACAQPLGPADRRLAAPVPAFAVGLRGGIGAATITNGSVVTISNPARRGPA